MLALARDGLAEGIWLRADRQTVGRGRLNRAWESPAGNLHCSTLVRLQPGDPPPATLAFVSAVAVWQAVDALLPGRASIKWPNDIMIGPAKLSGMLLERAGEAVVIGIGVNVETYPEGLGRPTTSLWEQGAAGSTPSALAEDIAGRFTDLLATWRVYGLETVRALWGTAAHPAGTALRASLPDGSIIAGQFSGLDTDCALILDLADGTSRAIHAGDVFLV
jgi:BirA family biotin operon repressor/biotin-[acetyl-CoA-carboxylase] ligase